MKSRQVVLRRLILASLALSAVWATPIFQGSADARQSTAQTFYVAADGAAQNDGSKGRPLDLATALSRSSPARPGDTIWLREGIYRGPFTSYLTGDPGTPITVRQFPGERAILDGASAPPLSVLTVLGSDAVYWGFEIMNSEPTRTSSSPGNPRGRGTGLTVHGARTKAINLIVHDALDGIGFWSDAVDSELYGNIVYNNGVEGPDRGHGHSVYVQNDTGTKRVRDNILFNSFSHGIHAYTEGGSLNNIYLEGNVSFNHGSLSRRSGLKPNILVGGLRIAHRPTLIENYLYMAAERGVTNTQLGQAAPCQDATIVRNYLAGAVPITINCRNLTLTGNVMYGDISADVRREYPQNEYHTARPSGSAVFVRPNIYDPGRAHIIVFNWDQSPDVIADISKAGLRLGDRYHLRDAQNILGAPLMTAVYDGKPIIVSMSADKIALPAGPVPRPPVHTGLEFGVFVLTRANAPPAPAALRITR